MRRRWRSLGERQLVAAQLVAASLSHEVCAIELDAIFGPEERALRGGQTLERLRVLDDFVTARRRGPDAGETVHELLTHVVDESGAICVSLGKELLGHA